MVVGRDGVIVFANGPVEDLLDYSPGTLAGLSVEALVPERYRKRHVDLRKMFHSDALMRPMGLGREIVALSQAGREIPIEINLLPATDSENVVAIIRDLTVILHARQQLESSAQRFRAVAVSSNDILTETDIETGVITWHGDVDGALGYEPGEFPRERSGWLEKVHPDDAEETWRLVEQATHSGSFRARYRVLCKDGSYRHWDSHCQIIEQSDGGSRILVGAIQDVTERVRSKEQLEASVAEAEASAALNQAILNSLLSHVAILDRDGTIVAVNDAWQAFGLENRKTDDEPVGVGVNYLDTCRSTADTNPEARHALDGVTAVLNGSRETFTMEYESHGQAEERWFWLVATPAKSAGGGAVVVHVPATDRVLARQELERTLREVARLKQQLEVEHAYLQEEIKTSHNFEEIIGESEPIKSMLEAVAQVAETEATVLLLGETGTGKELTARAIHSRSRRSSRALIKVDCATLPSGLVESELFGHMKGAFTGAHDSRPGRFEMADGGTIFLDEIGELGAELQAKLLRVLQEGEIQRLGARETKQIDVRVIAATNRDLKREVEEGRFRSDLYYRLNVFPIELPPLRHRREDIPLLTAFVLSKCVQRLGKRVDFVAPSVQHALNSYDWPGNVRELQNVIERAVILSTDGALVLTGVLGDAVPASPAEPRSLKLDLETLERQNILDALEESNWKIKGDDNAASRLGLSPSTLRSRMKRLGIEKPYDARGDETSPSQPH